MKISMKETCIMKTIAITNQKGGVGKTTTAWALAGQLAEQGKRVLAVDMDPQINFSLLNKDLDLSQKTVYDALSSPEKTPEFIQKFSDYDMLIGSQYLPHLENQLNNQPGREFRLRDALKKVEDDYDYCIIDTSPSLSTLTLNSMTAADYLVLPALADFLSYNSIEDLFQTYNSVKRYTNENLSIAGILLTRYNRRTKLSQAMTEELKNKAHALGTKIFQNSIREAVAVKEAQLMKEPLFSYIPTGGVTLDYIEFTKELLEEINE